MARMPRTAFALANQCREVPVPSSTRSNGRKAIEMKREKTRIMYVECAADLSHRGRARICRVRLSKSGGQSTSAG
jgi:hypothetical protein